MSTSEFSQSASAEHAAVTADPVEVERARREIQGLVAEIAELSRSQMSAAEFYDALLNKVVAALAAPGGAVWTVSDAGVLQLTYQINLRQTGLIENPIGQAQHGRLLHHVMQGSEGALVAPHSGTGGTSDDDEQAAANPTEFLLVLAPVLNDQGPQGVVEVFQRPGARVSTQRGYLRFVRQVCELAGDFLKAQRLRHLAEKQTLWEQLETFTRSVHEKLEVRQAAYTIANEGRRLIGCDRVSVAIRRGGRYRIEAVSGQDVPDMRSNTTVALGKLATAVARTGEDVWYTGDTSDMAPQVEEALDAYVDESHTKAMAILPLFEPRDEEEKFASEEDQPPAALIGALVVEQMADSRPPEGFLHRVEVVRSHSATAINNALEYEGLFLMPLWRLLGRSKKLFRGRTLPKTLTAITAAVALVAFLCFYPADFTLEGGGRLQPEARQLVFAPIAGEVQQVHVDHDASVAEGEVLIVLRNRDLEKEIESVNGQLQEVDAQIRSINRQLHYDDRQLSPGEQSQMQAEVTQLHRREATLRDTLELLASKREQLEIRSPMEGRVVTWKPDEKLRTRPVNQGEQLLELADPTGDWELEVMMPESRMGHVAEAWASAAQEDRDLRVTFFLATNPERQLEGHVVEVASAAEVRGEDGNTVLVRVTFDQQRLRETIGDPKIGALATAKVHCGTRSIGYKYLHDLINFVRAKILFRL